MKTLIRVSMTCVIMAWIANSLMMEPQPPMAIKVHPDAISASHFQDFIASLRKETWTQLLTRNSTSHYNACLKAYKRFLLCAPTAARVACVLG